MVKVLHVNASAAGGAFVVAQRLNAALNQTGRVQSSHLVFDADFGEDYQLWANNPIKHKIAFGLHALEKLDFIRFEKDRSIRFAFSHGKTGIPLFRHPLFKNADIVHLHWINKGFISLNGLYNLYKTGKKIVWTAHDMWPFTGGCYHPRGCENYQNGCGNCKYLKNPSTNDLSVSVLNKKLKLYKEFNPVITVPGHWSMEMAAKSAVSKYVRIKHIGNFINTEEFSPSEKVENTASRKFRIVFSSMNLLNPQKGLFDLADAINHMPDLDRFEIELLLVGNAKYVLPEIHCDKIQLGIISNVSEMVEMYRSADLLVVPSYEETFGLTVAEAQSCGVPVVAYDAGELPYNIVNEKTGFVCKTGDVKGLKKAILTVKNMSIDQRVLLSVASRELALERFSTSNAVERYLECYSSELGIQPL